jgi:hypothetical protein
MASLGNQRSLQAMTHFDKDWLNLTNLNSGGDFWPQIPTWQILIWLRQGVLSAAKKALGATRLVNELGADPELVYLAETVTDPADPRDTVLPLTTIWVCTGNHSSAGFEVDAVRGPTSVEMVIATPPPRIQSRLWRNVRPQVDAYWGLIHGDSMELPTPPTNEEPPLEDRDPQPDPQG